MRTLEGLNMNEFEENIYQEIKSELVQSTIERRVDTYFTNRNELTHYYNVGKMIVDVQGGDEKAEYGNKLIKKYSERLTSELGKGYSITSLKYMRQFWRKNGEENCRWNSISRNLLILC